MTRNSVVIRALRDDECTPESEAWCVREWTVLRDELHAQALAFPEDAEWATREADALQARIRDCQRR